MRLTLHKELLAGRYRAVVEALLDRKGGKALSEGDSASLIGALIYLGRMDEAEALYSGLERGKASPGALTVSRFFLGVGFVRISEYARAQKMFAQNEALGGKSALERFYKHLGNAFYTYYTGRYRAALTETSLARRAALRAGDLFARTLATDAYGHCRVVAGEIHHGLRLLNEAKDLAVKLGNDSLVNAIAVSLELYDAEYALSGEEGLATLERRLKAVGTEDNYSVANVGLEIARQYTLRGRFQDAAKTLELVAPAIYANQNRRQEIKLNLRLSELAFRRGDIFSARHYIRFLRRLLHREADSSFELSAVGIERKLAIAEGNSAESSELTKRWKELARDFGNTRDDNLRVRLGFLSAEKANQEDRVHNVLQTSRLAPALPQKLRPLLEAGYLCDVASFLELPQGANALAILPQSLGLLIQSPQGIFWEPTPLSSLQAKILRLLSTGDASKEKLVETVWGYRYDPLRHDAMVYSALSSLRKSLAGAADWVQATESGYRFVAQLIWHRASVEAKVPKEGQAPAAPRPPSPVSSQLMSVLNHRQIEILEWLRERRFLAVSEARAKFGVSEITALRDLDGLRRRGLVARNGKARATRYSLSEVAELGN
jgi:DNA-binding winged helix-turn-helix (wHTH) protein